MSIGDGRGLSYTEVLNTPVRDLFMLRDVDEEIRKLKQQMIDEANAEAERSEMK